MRVLATGASGFIGSAIGLLSIIVAATVVPGQIRVQTRRVGAVPDDAAPTHPGIERATS